MIISSTVQSSKNYLYLYLILQQSKIPDQLKELEENMKKYSCGKSLSSERKSGSHIKMNTFDYVKFLNLPGETYQY